MPASRHGRYYWKEVSQISSLFHSCIDHSVIRSAPDYTRHFVSLAVTSRSLNFSAVKSLVKICRNFGGDFSLYPVLTQRKARWLCKDSSQKTARNSLKIVVKILLSPFSVEWQNYNPNCFGESNLLEASTDESRFPIVAPNHNLKMNI